jgi:hypothetical protein
MAQLNDYLHSFKGRSDPNYPHTIELLKLLPDEWDELEIWQGDSYECNISIKHLVAELNFVDVDIKKLATDKEELDRFLAALRAVLPKKPAPVAVVPEQYEYDYD